MTDEFAEITPTALALPQASGYSGLGISTLRRLVAQGEIPAVRVGRRVMLLRADLDAFLAEHRDAA